MEMSENPNIASGEDISENGETSIHEFALLIPKTVRGMKRLDKSLFITTIELPAIKCLAKSCNKFLSVCKHVLLDRPHFRKVISHPSIGSEYRLVLLNSSLDSIDGLNEKQRSVIAEESGVFCKHSMTLTYEDFSFQEIIQSILPLDFEERISSFETIGHIAHVNLKPHLEPYKYVIGEILLDKNPCIKTVVNKTNIIQETFRYFSMELLAGEDKMMTRVSEHGCLFEFDYSKVYWNSRLHTEHRRLVEKMKPGDLIFDVFAGVGPFSIPAGKLGCRVYANDLNKVSYNALCHNAKLNKVESKMKIYNMDGRDFINEIIIEENLSDIHRNCAENPRKIHIIMNLPSLAPQFLDVFKEKYDTFDIPIKLQEYVIIHCYYFSKSKNPQLDAEMIVADALGIDISAHSSTHVVRRVAPNKVMVCVSFNLFWFESDSEKCSCNSSTSLFTRKRPLEGGENPIVIVKSKRSTAPCASINSANDMSSGSKI